MKHTLYILGLVTGFVACTNIEPVQPVITEPSKVESIVLSPNQNYNAIAISPNGAIWSQNYYGTYKAINDTIWYYPNIIDYSNSNQRLAFIENQFAYVQNGTLSLISDSVLTYKPDYDLNFDAELYTLNNGVFINDMNYYDYGSTTSTLTFNGNSWKKINCSHGQVFGTNGDFVAINTINGYIELINTALNQTKRIAFDNYIYTYEPSCVDSNGDLIGINSSSVYRYNYATSDVTEFFLGDIFDSYGTYTAVAANNGLNIAIASVSGVSYLLNLKTKQSAILSTDGQFAANIYIDNLSRIWVINDLSNFDNPSVNLFCYNQNLQQTHGYGFVGADVVTVLKTDAQNHVWFSIWNQSAPYFKDLIEFNGSDFVSHADIFTTEEY